MVKQASLFSQVLCLVDRHHFEREVRRWNAERHAKGFSCWSQFVAMMFCQLAQAKSLREIVDAWPVAKESSDTWAWKMVPAVPRSATPMPIDPGNSMKASSIAC